MHSKQTKQISPSQFSYGMSLASMSDKMDYVVKQPHTAVLCMRTNISFFALLIIYFNIAIYISSRKHFIDGSHALPYGNIAMYAVYIYTYKHIYIAMVLDFGISSVLALKIPQPCTVPSI